MKKSAESLELDVKKESDVIKESKNLFTINDWEKLMDAVSSSQSVLHP